MLALFYLLTVLALPSDAPKELPLPGETFVILGRAAFVIPPTDHPAPGKPWVWYAPTLPGLPGKEEQWMFRRFLDAGISIAGMDAGESYGSPSGNLLFDQLYREMVDRGYSPKPVLLGRSRGGLMALSWALENSRNLSAFAGIYPVCNLASYPGVEKAAGAYGLSAEVLKSELAEHNPVDRLEKLAALARLRVPFFAIHGDSDKVVPLEANSALLKKRYEAAGGSMELLVPPGQGHNMWSGFFQCEELVEFVIAHANRVLSIATPLDYQVVQRRGESGGRIAIGGSCENLPGKRPKVEARLVSPEFTSPWESLSIDRRLGKFRGSLKAPAGGWYRVETRLRAGAETVATTVVEHVGVGEVFVVAGQSNSANHGEERQKTTTGLVAAFDGKHWQLANDPQPGASGSGGSFMPSFGDAVAERFHIPVGIVACGVGATSVREWLPAGSRFAAPPTLLGNVRQTAAGDWESTGRLYNSFCARMKALGLYGFRAILWHQGESDANQPDPSRSLSTADYTRFMEQIIQSTRKELGWNVPWFVAQASYHVPGDEGSPEIRAAQAQLWTSGLAGRGPDTDALKGDLRDNRGQGVHFSGAGLRKHGALWANAVGHWLQKQIR